MFDTCTLFPNDVKHGARSLSKTQAWGQTGRFTPTSLLVPQPVTLLAGSTSLLWLDQLFASPGVKCSLLPWGSNCHSII